ncbi:anaerobic carbon-monoxide dehydrogenase catalytic subunit [Candidatus Bipolaricaulota bacterium]|nr:anaerobic carbon-monoxide dehydrogenase catalytic subunit [Candidatus Bipolaricaulota bacterium]
MPENKKEKSGKKSADPASLEVLDAVKDNEDLDSAWNRYDDMQPQCEFGQDGICCRICNMGPCRIIPGKSNSGVCGATADTIAARNLVRMIAAGAAAHSDHGRDVVHTLIEAIEGEDPDYEVKDYKKLKKLARDFGVDEGNGKKDQLATNVADKSLAEFGRQKGVLTLTERAPDERYELWEEEGLLPRGVDREIVETMHRTHMGVDTDYRHILKQGLRCALSDGWGGTMIATDVQDVLFGTPEPLQARVNLGVLEEDSVNLIVHGHEPALSEVFVEAARDPDLIEFANDRGAENINVAGICCTANEILMRHGIPVAGNFLQQELAIMTGMVELMMVDVQCIMPALSKTVKNFHTDLVTTSPKAKFPGVEHKEFSEESALKTAKDIVKKGIENFENRDREEQTRPEQKEVLVGGFSSESVFDFLGGTYRSTYRPLNDAIIDGRLLGAAGVVGCNNPDTCHDYNHTELAKELIKNDVLVVSTGCSAIADGKAGLMKPEVAFEMAGEGLEEICRAVGIPPVLHLGSCVDNSRILTLLSNMVAEGGLGNDISELPVAGAAPEWMSEKAVSIGFYFVASGVYTLLNKPFPVTGSENVMDFLTEDIEDLVGGKFAFEEDPKKAAGLIIDHIKVKREELGLKQAMYAKNG